MTIQTTYTQARGEEKSGHDCRFGAGKPEGNSLPAALPCQRGTPASGIGTGIEDRGPSPDR